MKKLILLLLILTSCISNSQEIKEVKFSELDYTIPKDSTSMVISLKNKPLNGKYKLINDKFPTRFSLTEFIDGKGEGKSEYYSDGILIGTKELKNGLPNGLSVVYDNTGETLMWKIQMVNGKNHGLAWFGDEGDKYYIMDKEATKK